VTEYLKKDDYVQVGKGLLIGERVNINHCKEGRSNAALYVTRTDDAILAYCHHCGLSGSEKINKGSTGAYKKPEQVSKVTHPTSYNMNIDTWAGWARLIIMKAGLSDTDLLLSGIGYSSEQDVIVLPIRYDSTLLGYQYRTNPMNRQKYITNFCVRSVDLYPKVCYTHITSWGLRAEPINSPLTLKEHQVKASPNEDLLPSNVLVIVEDILSYTKLCKLSLRDINLSIVCLLGTSLKAKDLSKLSSLITRQDKIIIFLDDDNLQVKKKQTALKEQLAIYTTHSKIVIHHASGIDPKEHSLLQLDKIISTCIGK